LRIAFGRLPAAEQRFSPQVATSMKGSKPMNTEHFIVLAIIVVMAAVPARLLIRRYRHVFVVSEGFNGLLYHNGKLIGSLKAGRHVRWGRYYHVAPIDSRKVLLQVQGQEVLSADNIAVKLSVVLTTQVVDAAKATTLVDNWATHIYNAAQGAIRAAVAAVDLEALLKQRAGISEQVRQAIGPLANDIGVDVHAVEVRDIMLSGDLRKAFSDVVKAKQEGQAALERARGESSALRNLSNAARLLDDQPALATLRLLQALSDNNSKQTIVMNDISAFAAVMKQRPTSKD
jgi:regulator of protease activity HflC (stomatin/prohibitin superfamily)